MVKKCYYNIVKKEAKQMLNENPKIEEKIIFDEPMKKHTGI